MAHSMQILANGQPGELEKFLLHRRHSALGYRSPAECERCYGWRSLYEWRSS